MGAPRGKLVWIGFALMLFLAGWIVLLAAHARESRESFTSVRTRAYGVLTRTADKTGFVALRQWAIQRASYSYLRDIREGRSISKISYNPPTNVDLNTLAVAFRTFEKTESVRAPLLMEPNNGK